MSRSAPSGLRGELSAVHRRLVRWLADAAYPLWSARGVDAVSGGFVEALAVDGSALPAPRRARVQPRQIYAFASAPRFGWHGDSAGIVRRGVDYLQRHYRRADGLYRTLAGADGRALDDSAVLYDQAFVLYGLAAAAQALDSRLHFEGLAVDLRDQIERRFRAADGAFYSTELPSDVREANPHMHLLEACLAWAGIGADAGWSRWVRDIAAIARSRFMHARSGAIGEVIGAPGDAARAAPEGRIEPGHQFEWGWLLLQVDALGLGEGRDTALRLIDLGESAGVHGDVAVNFLREDLSVADASARLWPQTERLKAALLAAQLSGEARYWRTALAAAHSWLPYLDTSIPGLWFDLKSHSGKLVEAPVPASTFYHLVGAITAFDLALGGSGSAGTGG